MDEYTQFLKSKVQVVHQVGMDVPASALHPSTLPHQADAIRWALKVGRALLAMSFGLGKTHVQVEIARQVVERAGGKFLIVCPLGVRHQFTEEDGPRLGVHFQYVRTDEEVAAATTPYLITNYERVRDGGIDVSQFSGISLDEGSVLRSLGSKTQDTFTRLCRAVPYRFVATATPSPNEYREIIYYAQFLEHMDIGQALTRWFKRDPNKAGNLTIHPHHEEAFWMWVASWALFVNKPGDLGHSDVGYDLPELRVHWHRLPVDHTRAWEQADNRGQHRLLLDAAAGVTEATKEKRATMEQRVSVAMEIALQYLGKQTFSNGKGQDEDATGTQQGVLPSKPRGIETAEAGVLLRKQGQDRPREEERVHAGLSENAQAQAHHAGEERGDQPQAPGTVRDRYGVSGTRKGKGEGTQSAQPRREAEQPSESGVWNIVGTVQRYSGQAGRVVRHLRSDFIPVTRKGEAAQVDVHRPRSQHGGGKGSSLSSLQLRDRPLLRQSGPSANGSGVSNQVVVWCHLNDEQKAFAAQLKKHERSVSSIAGSLSIDETERRLYQWKHRGTEVLLSKPVMLGSGLNLQQCSKVIFLGVDYRFQDFIQAIHRTHRFQQAQPVDVHIIYAESEDEIVSTLRRKWQQHDRLVARMSEIIRQYGLSEAALAGAMQRSLGVMREETVGQLYTAIHNDTVQEAPAIASDSVGLLLTSIPFGNHYEYAASLNDFGHNDDDDRFFTQMDYLIPHLYRTLMPGRVAAIHVKDRIMYGWQGESGFMWVNPFSDKTVAAFQRHGFLYQGRITITTDVVRENNSTYRLGYTEMTRDGSKMGVGLPEYVLLFRKPPSDNTTARADTPVVKSKEDYSIGKWQLDAHAFWRSNGNRPLAPWEAAAHYDYDAHVAEMERLDGEGNLPKHFLIHAPESPSFYCWSDVNLMQGLNAEQARRRQENHVCPLPFDIVDRLIRRYSNEGDVVYDPFAGLFTVPYCAVRMGRRGLGVELNHDYFTWGARYMQAIERQALAPTLFDLHDFLAEPVATEAAL